MAVFLELDTTGASAWDDFLILLQLHRERICPHKGNMQKMHSQYLAANELPQVYLLASTRHRWVLLCQPRQALYVGNLSALDGLHKQFKKEVQEEVGIGLQHVAVGPASFRIGEPR